jgi:hypothetical protein
MEGNNAFNIDMSSSKTRDDLAPICLEPKKVFDKKVAAYEKAAAANEKNTPIPNMGTEMPIERIWRANMLGTSKIVQDGMTVDRCLTACMGFEITALASKPDTCLCFKSAAAFLERYPKEDLESCMQEQTQEKQDNKVRPNCSGDVRIGGVCGSTDKLDVYLVSEHGKYDAERVLQNSCPTDLRFESYRFDGNQCSSSVQDTENWDNNYNHNCASYVSSGWCADGKVLQAWTVTGQYNHPDQNCVACGKGKS